MKKVLFAMGCLLAVLWPTSVDAQFGTVSDMSALSGGFYAGLKGGTAFGKSTFGSISKNGNLIGYNGGLFAGWRFSRILSAELSGNLGSFDMQSLPCCPYWMSKDIERFMAPVLDQDGWYYRDITASTSFKRLALQLNVNILPILVNRESRWQVNVSPQFGLVTTETSFEGDYSTLKKDEFGYYTIHEHATRDFDAQWHASYGGELSASFLLTNHITLHAYGNIAMLTGERFDMVPHHCHESNFIYEAGLKAAWNFGRDEAALARANSKAGLKAGKQAGKQHKVKAQKPAKIQRVRNQKPVIQDESDTPATTTADTPAPVDDNDVNDKAGQQEATPVVVVSDGDGGNGQNKVQPGNNGNNGQSGQNGNPATANPDEDLYARPAAIEDMPEEIQKLFTGLPIIYFQNNSSFLTEEALKDIKAALTALQAYPDLVVGLYGYCSNVGSVQYNKWLADRRCERVRSWLISQGLNARQIKFVTGVGIDYYARNYESARRVEFVPVEDK